MLAALLCISYSAYSSPTLLPKTDTGSSLDTNTLLAIVAIILLVPIYLLGRTLLFSAKMFIKKDGENKGNSGALKTLLVLFSLVAANAAMAQDAAAPVAAASNSMPTSTMVLVGVIIVEALVILFLGTYILAFLKGTQYSEAAAKGETIDKTSFLSKWWKKSNNFIPIEEEGSLDSGHSYDGIRELDNNIPSWFTAAFVLCILFAITYLWRYHVSQSAPLQIDEYKNEMAQAAIEKEEYLKNAGNNVDENSIKMLDAAGIAEGKTLFAANCVACHGATGASMAGGVGPNLTDAYWLHGGSLKDVFKTIKYGWPDKGMRSWKDQFSPKQIAELASFVKSISNTNVAGGKDKQGELYSEEAAAPKDSSAVKKDSAATTVKTDSTTKK